MKLIVCFYAELGVITHRCLRKPLEEVDPSPYELTFLLPSLAGPATLQGLYLHFDVRRWAHQTYWP